MIRWIQGMFRSWNSWKDLDIPSFSLMTMMGDIDDVRIFPLALTEDEIAAIASQ